MLNINDAQFRLVKINKETGEVLPISYHHYKSTALYDYNITKTLPGSYDIEIKVDGVWKPYE